MGVEMQVLNANTANEIDAAFETVSREQPDALFVAPTPFLSVRLVQLAQLAAFHRLPSTHVVREGNRWNAACCARWTSRTLGKGVGATN